MRIAAALSEIKVLHETPPRMIDPNAVIAEFEKLFRSNVGDKVSLRTNLDPQLGRIKADPRTIEWVLLNLAVNAFKAMLVRNVVIATSNVELDQETACEMNLSAGSYIRVELGVTGSGVDAQPAIRNILQQAHGGVSVRDAATQGVTITILLPRMSVEEMPSRKPAGAAGHGTVT